MNNYINLKKACNTNDLELLRNEISLVPENMRNYFLNKLDTTTGTTLLHLAIKNEALEVVEELLKHGANPNSFDSLQYTPLFEAVLFKNINIVKILLKYGANPTLKNKLNCSPRELAEKYNFFEITENFSQYHYKN
ncbi:MAG: ankyrin repeat domain-containing protein [Sphingobacteriia bacterium]|nr:ankyrin repeat domain-containing protein [Sphingobacteriia bacterium]